MPCSDLSEQSEINYFTLGYDWVEIFTSTSPLLTWTMNIIAAGRMASGAPIRLIRAIDTNAVWASRTLWVEDKTNVMKHSSATWWIQCTTQHLDHIYQSDMLLMLLSRRIPAILQFPIIFKRDGSTSLGMWHTWNLNRIIIRPLGRRSDCPVIGGE